MSSSIIRIYTDGACTGNPGPGGYGIRMEFNQHVKEFSQGYKLTTNNRMELMAVIEGLKAIKNNTFPVEIYTDSKYVADSVDKGWLWNWEKKGFKKVKNPDLWKEYIPLHKLLNPTFIWIKGHAGHPQNERCDVLAVKAARSRDLLIDIGYSPEIN